MTDQSYTCACGCINAIHEPSGILHCVRKCPKHAAKYRDPATLDRRYYEELGIIKGENMLPTAHLREMAEALGAIPRPQRPDAMALEIGCGVSPYCPMIEDTGYTYAGLDMSPFVRDWMYRNFHVPVFLGDFEHCLLKLDYSFILAAHCIEHMHDAPAAIAKMTRLLEPGGELWIIVPDDSDPVNPDHWWFFTEATLRSTIEAAGLATKKIVMRKYVKHENFFYCRARKP